MNFTSSGPAHASSVYVVNGNGNLAAHAFLWQQQGSPCAPTPSDGTFAFYLGGQLSNYFYIQNCDGMWFGDGQYHWTMYDFSGNSPCGGFRGPCGTFNFGDWAANSFFILGWGGGAYLDPQGNVTPALILQGDTSLPPDPRGLPITVSHADTLFLQDTTNVWSAGTDFHPIFSPFTLSPAATSYHAQNSFAISRVHIGSNIDGSLNNHDGVGNARAWIFNTNGTVIASSTNTCYGEGGCNGADLVFATGTIIPPDFVLSFIAEDGLQGDAGWSVSQIGFYAEDPHPAILSLNQFTDDGTTTIAEGGTAAGSAMVFKGALQSASTDPLVLQIEVEPFGTPFINIVTATSATISSGQNASVTVAGLSPGQYHWQARTIDMANLIASPWQEFGSTGNVDFVLASEVFPPPSVANVSPSFALQAASGLTFLVTGNNFQPTATLSFRNEGVSVGSYSQRTGTEIVATISVGTNAQPGPTDVTVTNPDGQTSTLVGSFTVIAVTPPLQRDLGGQKQQQNAAEPVSTGTGNYYYQHTDFTVPGRGKPLRFERTYNTLDGYQGPLGANWTHSYNVTLTQASDGTVGVKWGDGHVEVFTSDGSVYLPEPGVYSTLSGSGDGSFTLTTKDQTRYSFSALGKLMNCTDKNGNGTTLAYDGAGDLIQVTDLTGRVLTLSYDLSGRIISVTDPSGRSESFVYDLNNNLAKATDAAGGATSYTYDINHRVLSITLANGNTLLQNTYDVGGRVVAQTNGLGRTWTFAYGAPNATDTTVTDARGNATIHTYDALLRIVQIKDPLGGIVSFTYDGNNNRTSVTNQNGNTTTFSYDGQGNVTGIKDPKGNISAFTYDGRNDVVTATDANGNVTSFGYDSKSNLTSIQDALGQTTAFTYDGLGELSSKTDATGNTTSYGHDAFGNLTSVTDALGHTTHLAYDAIGRLIATTDANGHTSQVGYDGLSRLVVVTGALNHQTAFAYDPVGNLLTLTDANGNTTNYAYDAVNNLVTVTDALGHPTQYSYDENNNRTAFVNAKGNTTLYTYDPLNRLSAATDPLAFVTKYNYDGVGNLFALTDANGIPHRFAYDALNRLVSFSPGDGRTIAYTYDPNGNRTEMVEPHRRTAYAYDALNRLISVRDTDSNTVQYQYDAVGNRQSLTYPDGKVVTYDYDPVNRLSQVHDWLGRVTNYHYDPAGNLLSLTYPNQAGVSFTYDDANRLTTVINSFLKPGGKEDELSHHFGIFEYLLDAVGNRLQVSNGQGKVIRYSYDKLYELTGITTEKTGDDDDDRDDDKMIASYEYDAVGNRVRATSRDRVITYSYDATDRLLRAGDAQCTFDANGNQTSITRGDDSSPIIYQYDAMNRLISVTGGRVDSAFSYDGDGNQIGQTVGSATFNYVNDVASVLPVVLQQSGPDGDISFAYGLNLILESGTGFDNFYQYDGLGSVVGLTDLQGRLTQRYVYDAWGAVLRANFHNSLVNKNRFRFTGETFDPENRLYYLRARYYDPTVGRMLSRDPISIPVASPYVRNSYSYALNNPQRFTDHTGLAPGGPKPTTLTASIIGVLTTDTFHELKSWTDYIAEFFANVAESLAPNPIPASPSDTIQALTLYAGSELDAAQRLKTADPSMFINSVETFLTNGNSPQDAVNNAIVDLGYSVAPVVTAPVRQELMTLVQAYYDPHTSELIRNEAAFRSAFIDWYQGFAAHLNVSSQ